MLKHNHIIIRAEVKKPPKDIRFVRKWIKKFVRAIDMKMLGQPNSHYVYDKGNRGLTCLAILSTSHIALHTWDEVSPALMQLDVYSCSDLDKKIVFKQIEQFEPKEINYVTIDREKDIKIDKLVASWEKYNETRNKIKKKEEQVLLDTYCKGKL